jgi:hypothetical protein
VFTAYYDESGSPDAHSVVVAGFVASDDQWKEFERNWNESLHQFGISHFHAVEFAQSVGEFAKWKGHEKNPDLQGKRTYSEKDLETFCLNARIPRRDSIDAKEFEGLTRKEIEAKLLQIWGVPTAQPEP